MKVSKYMINKVEVGMEYSISDFEKLWKIKIQGKYRQEFYDILKDNFTYEEVGSTKSKRIIILSKIEKVNNTALMADMIYYVLYHHAKLSLTHSYCNILDIEDMVIFPQTLRKGLKDIGYNPYEVVWEDEELEAKKKFFEKESDLRSRAIKHLKDNYMVEIVRYCENNYCEDISDKLSVYDYYKVLSTRFNKMFPSNQFRHYTEIYNMSEEQKSKFFNMVDKDFNDLVGLRFEQIFVNYHIRFLDDCDVEIDYHKVRNLITDLVSKSKQNTKKTNKE